MTNRAPTTNEMKFLHQILSWSGAATPQEIGPQLTQKDNSVRQTCKRRGWVTFDRYYWRITDAGREAYKFAPLSQDREAT